ncbi:hypothetical protein P154DRAFT_424457 [Amniculicola lignicola CBS 123094]|uniref:Uncharacterized protein n=1 Tax=Amniculicola lignicola CBS 123094 TaxID=1392246 RepID=A0A6A5X1F2_9PLEO|nr:hypothetical protein P154DRAFT_424457 [Amniculicola lignicola CBS 123094]
MCGNTSPETKWVQESPSKHFIGWVQGCEEVSKIREGEPMRCKTCGSRVLYKMRTKRMVQFEAR